MQSESFHVIFFCILFKFAFIINLVAAHGRKVQEIQKISVKQ
jgi:hypothetical protein